MSFWKIDLTTEDGAANAAATGGTACFIAGGLTLLGAVFAAGTIRMMGGQAPIVLGFAAASIVIYLSAGIRLREGKGVFWGGTAVVLLVLEVLTKLVTLSLFGLLINAILLIVIANGVRGAWALRKGGVDDDTAEVFE